MKLERTQDALNSPEQNTPSEAMFDFEFTQTNSNKDSGIETGDEYANKRDLDECQNNEKFYVTPSIQHRESDADEIYGNIVDDPPLYDYDPLPRQLLQQHESNDKPDRPPKTNVLEKLTVRESSTEDEVYGNLSHSGQSACYQQYDKIPEGTRPVVNINDEIYECPPTSTVANDNRSSLGAVSSAQDEIYDCPPPSNIARDNRSSFGAVSSAQDEIYDCPPPSTVANDNRSSFGAVSSAQDEIYDCPPPSNIARDNRPSFGAVSSAQDEIYDCPPPSNIARDNRSSFGAVSSAQDEIYDCPPPSNIARDNRSSFGAVSSAQDEIYDCPSKTNVVANGNQFSEGDYTADDIYDAPPKHNMDTESGSFTRTISQVIQQKSLPVEPPQAVDDEELYDTPPRNGAQAITSEIYDAVPQHQQKQQHFLRTNSELIQQKQLPTTPSVDEELYDVVPNSHRHSQAPTAGHVEEPGDEVYDNVPQQRRSGSDSSTGSQQQKAFIGRSNSEAIQQKSLPQEPGSEDIYDTPPKQQHNQPENTDMSGHSRLSQSQQLPYLSLETDEIYDVPPSKNPDNSELHGKSSDEEETYECLTSAATNNEYDHNRAGSEPIFDTYPYGGSRVPQGYDVGNNNEDVYDAVPQCIVDRHQRKQQQQQPLQMKTGGENSGKPSIFLRKQHFLIY